MLHKMTHLSKVRAEQKWGLSLKRLTMCLQSSQRAILKEKKNVLPYWMETFQEQTKIITTFGVMKVVRSVKYIIMSENEEQEFMRDNVKEAGTTKKIDHMIQVKQKTAFAQIETTAVFYV
ncbi:hypothetical protein JOC94_001986 [Bacillus thermophilus]|uniref:Uncharacterized protein n=1 Tax=Siminovitchia thermophila TaxID=1245522 RepID=A0ABS2R795_9BACI|nr:hypothetical protein [Siminovitchia thermophila]MBM7715014.1 hypothetical protein [Siminovitchia thermophila]ONK22378.1 hypothetical protein BLX87_16495 [Bacillus sp. VT-16-64]